MRDFLVSLHEAAHIVVGMAVGLRVRRAVLGPKPNHGTVRMYGCVWFHDRHATPTQLALAYAAGCAWDRSVKTPNQRGYEWVDGDAEILRRMRYTKREIDALALSASAILHGRASVHARVARALYEHDLDESDLEAIAVGEP